MSTSYQSSYSAQDVNVIVPAPRAQEPFNSFFIPAGESTYPTSRARKSGSLQPGATFSYPITVSSNSPSPSLLLPPLQLSTSTLFRSDFPSTSDRSSASAPQDEHPSVHTPSPHGGPVPGSWTVGRTASADALERHMKASLPQVEEASKHLQQILGMRNEEAFQPPTPPVRPGQGTVGVVGSAVDFNPALRHLRGSTAGLGVQIRDAAAASGPGYGRTSGEMAEACAREENHARGGGGHQGQQRRRAEKMSLRESLLMHGRQPYGNQARTELRSLTFHDLTPDIRTGGFKNELLAHFEADREGRTRLVCYEVDVPAPQHHQLNYHSNGMPRLQHPQTERWISFLISTPLLNFRPNVAQTTPSLPPNLLNTAGNAHMPTSWLIFAAPLAAITSHPPSKDNLLHRSSCGAETLRPVNRYDYDFSHNGIPAFEFMNKPSVLGPLGTHLEHAMGGGPFLSAKGLGAYAAGKDWIRRPGGAHGKTQHDHYDDEDDGADNDEDDDDELGREEDLRRWEDTENLQQEMANSWWWNDALARFLEDKATWARVRESMGRGCCRVVLRVEEEAEAEAAAAAAAAQQRTVGGTAGKQRTRRMGGMVGMEA